MTTRFPSDAVLRFSQQADFEVWKDRLHVYSLDFRHTIGVEMFAAYLNEKYDRLDVLVHNACQTIRRPPAYYRHLLSFEERTMKDLPQDLHRFLECNHTFQDRQQSQSSSSTAVVSDQGKQIANVMKTSPTDLNQLSASSMTQLQMQEGDEEDSAELFPVSAYDVNRQQIDLRTKNSWLLKLGEVQTPEVVEVFSINTLAPFILNSRLKNLMLRSETAKEEGRYIINVSAMEGKFYRYKKATHPHTNMAKAALNMMTRTCSEDLAKQGVYMNSVDTGWINDENPLEKAAAYAKGQNFQTPIDEVDAAARILAPAFDGINGEERVFGQFLKDYRPTEW